MTNTKYHMIIGNNYVYFLKVRTYWFHDLEGQNEAAPKKLLYECPSSWTYYIDDNGRLATVTHKFQACEPDNPIIVQCHPIFDDTVALAAIMYNLPPVAYIRSAMLQALYDTFTARVTKDAAEPPTETFALRSHSTACVLLTEKLNTKGGLPPVGDKAKNAGRTVGFGPNWRDYINAIRKKDQFPIHSILIFAHPDMIPTVRIMLNVTRSITYVRLLGSVLNVVGTRARMLQTLTLHQVQMLHPNIKAIDLQPEVSGIDVVNTILESFPSLYRAAIQRGSPNRLLLFASSNQRLGAIPGSTSLTPFLKDKKKANSPALYYDLQLALEFETMWKYSIILSHVLFCTTLRYEEQLAVDGIYDSRRKLNPLSSLQPAQDKIFRDRQQLQVVFNEDASLDDDAASTSLPDTSTNSLHGNNNSRAMDIDPVPDMAPAMDVDRTSIPMPTHDTGLPIPTPLHQATAENTLPHDLLQTIFQKIQNFESNDIHLQTAVAEMKDSATVFESRLHSLDQALVAKDEASLTSQLQRVQSVLPNLEARIKGIEGWKESVSANSSLSSSKPTSSTDDIVAKVIQQLKSTSSQATTAEPISKEDLLSEVHHELANHRVTFDYNLRAAVEKDFIAKRDLPSLVQQLKNVMYDDADDQLAAMMRIMVFETLKEDYGIHRITPRTANDGTELRSSVVSLIDQLVTAGERERTNRSTMAKSVAEIRNLLLDNVRPHLERLDAIADDHKAQLDIFSVQFGPREPNPGPYSTPGPSSRTAAPDGPDTSPAESGPTGSVFNSSEKTISPVADVSMDTGPQLDTVSPLGKRHQDEHASDPPQDVSVRLCGQDVPPPVYFLPAKPTILCLETIRVHQPSSLHYQHQNDRVNQVELDLDATVITQMSHNVSPTNVHPQHLPYRVKRDQATIIKECKEHNLLFDLILIDCYNKFQIQDYCGDERTCHHYYAALVNLLSELSNVTGAAVIPGYGKHNDYFLLPQVRQLFKSAKLCVEKVHPAHHVLYAVSKDLDIGLSHNHVGKFVYYIQRSECFVPQLDKHDWVVPPTHTAPIAPLLTPPKSLDVWRLSKAAVLKLPGTLPLCTCTAKCNIRGASICSSYLSRRECGTQCNALECDNKCISSFEPSHPRLKVVPTDLKGFGVYTHYPTTAPKTQQGDILGEFAGICTTSLDTMNPGYHCVIKMNSDLYLVCYGNPIDPLYKAQYINHSCSPNSEIQVWTDAHGWPRALVIARHEIPTDQEVTVDYNMTQHHYGTRTVCHCGAANCRGYIERAPPVPPRQLRKPTVPPAAMSSSTAR
jgi:hypothetical protein